MVWKVDSDEGIEQIVKATGKSRSEVQAMLDHYERLHWGHKPGRVIHIKDPLVPDAARMGALVGLYLRDGNDDYVGIEFPENGSHLAVHEPTERLFLVTPESYRRKTKRLFNQYSRAYPEHVQKLSTLSRKFPGQQNNVKPWPSKSWPNIDVFPLGTATHILYFTDKVGDGPSTYIHEFGEESGKLPGLAADATGRLWLAGGDYTTPEEGITN